MGRRLDTLASPLVRVRHDRRITGSRANIDHVVICPTGVFVVDAKRYKGRPHLGTEGGLFSPRTEKLVVGTRDCTRLVNGALNQAELVRHALEGLDTDVVGVLCFVEADWPMLGGDFHTRDVYVTWPKKLATRITRPGHLAEPQIDAIQRRLTESFPAS